MKTTYLSQVFDDIQPEIEKIENPDTKRVVVILENLVEDLASANGKLRDEIQALKDEINKFKGEQGKPKIKPNKNGDISSEEERKDAESPDEHVPEGFKLDKPSLEKLKEDRIPAEILEKLKSLKGKKYTSEVEFTEVVKSVIGNELAEEQMGLLVKYARYKRREGKPKRPIITIDREESCPVDVTQLPEDAVFKGYEEKVVQDLIITTDNVKFKRAMYYSSSLKKVYLGEIPIGYEGDYGPHIRSNIISMKYVNGMSIPKIKEFCTNVGLIISGSTISNLLTKDKYINVFHQEKSDLYRASLDTSSYQQIDDTSSRVNGITHYTQIVCNPLATVFFTTERKDRLTILDVLRNFESRNFIFNEEAFSLLKKLKVSDKIITLLHRSEKNVPLDEPRMAEILQEIFPDPTKGKLIKTRIMEASAIAYYHQEIGVPIVEILVGDDAPQFKLLTEDLSLCWVHDGRHYKRLTPIVPTHKAQLKLFRERYWQYYRKLFHYKKNPSSEQAKTLSTEFDTLFATKTGYDNLDERIIKSKAKKGELLTVLKHPELPLHNNLSENGARVQKRREDVSLQTKTKEGTKAKDTLMTIVETCKKHGFSSYEYIYDRVSKTFKMPSLSKLIRSAKVNSPPAACDSS